MADIQSLIDYLKINRRQEEEKAKNNITIGIVDQNYNEINRTTKEVLLTDITKKSTVVPLAIKISFTNQTSVYISQTGSNIVYYKQQEVADGNGGVQVEYRNINDITDWEVLDDTNFIAVQLNEGKANYYYSYDIERIVVLPDLPDVYIYPDVFAYDADKVDIGEHQFDYKDHEGYTNSLGDRFLREAFDVNPRDSEKKRKVQVSKASQNAKVFLYPQLKYKLMDNSNEYRYSLRYVYIIPGEKRYDKNKQYASAIVVRFTYIGALLEFLNQTIFYIEYLELSGNKGIKKVFVDTYSKFIDNEISGKRNDINGLLELFHYTPKIFLETVNKSTLWDVVGTALQSSLTNVGLNKEDIVLKVLRTIATLERTPTIFLSELLAKKNGKESYFYGLFNKMNTDNFVAYTNFIKEIWLKSKFSNPEYKVFNAKKDKKEVFDGPIVLPYTSDKTLGIYHSNTDIGWIDNYSKFEVKLETGKIKRTGRRTYEDVTIDYTYHPFQPIGIKNVDQQKTELKLEHFIPAFYLKAVEEKKAVANTFTSIEYGVDVITTISGVGNLLKLRHLTKVSKLGKVISSFKKGAAIIEITSGTTNALLKLTGIADTELGNALSEYLFYLEMLSLSVDVTDWIRKGLKKSATNVLEHSDDLNKHLDELVEKGEMTPTQKTKVLDELAEVSEKNRNTGKFTINNEGEITLKKFNKISDRVKKEYGVSMHLIDRNNETFIELFKRWQQKPLQGFWVDQKLISKNYKIELEGPALYLFKGATAKGVYKVTSYTVQHELYHMKMWLKIKESYPKSYLKKFHEIPDEVHEAYVLSEFVKAKKFSKKTIWDEGDIIDDLDAFNINFGQNKNLKYFETFDLEDYLKIS